MSCSPEEKEKLRKRLQKLFQNVESDRKPSTGKSNTKRQRRKSFEDNIQQTNQLADVNNIDSNDITKAKQHSQKKHQMDSKPAAKQNGFVKPKGKKNSPKTLKKSEENVLINDKHTQEYSLQKKRNSEEVETHENHSMKQQSRSTNLKTSNEQINKIDKQVKQNSETKKAENDNKNPRIIEKTIFVDHLEPNVSKSSKFSANDTKSNKKQKKKTKKRTAPADTLRTENVIQKKQKLNKQTGKGDKRSAQRTSKKRKNEVDKDSYSSALGLEGEYEYDINNMSGHIDGGEFDSDYEDSMAYEYWMQKGKHGECSFDDNDTIKKFKRNTSTGLKKYIQKSPSVSEGGEEEEYYDSDDYDREFVNFYSDSCEEDQENYSDFDENDYEEDEDSYNYSMDDYDDYSHNCEEYYDMPFDYNIEEDSDEDYQLPKYVLEDLIIHKGTAIKHDLKPEDIAIFDSEDEEAQIVELENECSVKVICQPKAYEKEEMLKLQYAQTSLSVVKLNKKEGPNSNESEDCPNLVPIIDQDGFQLYNPNEEAFSDTEDEESEDYSMDGYKNDSMDDVSLGSEYIEINSEDADSLLSEDINEKYLNRKQSDSDSDINANIWQRNCTVDIIDATGYAFENKAENSNSIENSDIGLNDDVEQIPSLKLSENVDSRTESSILSTPIVDNEMFLPNDPKESDPSEESNQNQKMPEDEFIITPQNEIQSEDVALSPKVSAPKQSLLNYNTKFFNAFNSNSVLVLLKDPFYIYGTVRLTLLSGSVQVYGHPLVLNTEVEIFSPRGCSVIEISPSPSTNKISNDKLMDILKNYESQFAIADLNKIAKLCDREMDAVVLLKRNEGRKKIVQQFKKFMNENVFPNINNINVDRPLYNSEYLLRCMINTSAREQKCLSLPQQWQDLNITTKSRVMVAGGKGVGKSTLLRYLINRHLPQEMLLIDLDIGQPELFIPQTISCTVVKQPLLGPGFFLNIQPEMAYAVGHTNIVLCAHKYIEAVRCLISHCKSQEKYQKMPWLVNTMGYNKGFGLELISTIAHELPLTDVIQLQSNKEINNFDSILDPYVLTSVPSTFFSKEEVDHEEEEKEKLNYRLHVWRSAVEQTSRYQKTWEMSPKDMRFAMILSRLSEALQGHAEWLTDIKPFSASMSDLKIINLVDNKPNTSSMAQLAKAIEANLVYLCHYEEETKPLKCLGIGVIRAVDFHVNQLYLIPAMPYTQLKEVNSVAIGEFPLPTSLYTNQGPRVKNTAPYVYNTTAASASRAIKQIYYRPRRFLTGKHKSLD